MTAAATIYRDSLDPRHDFPGSDDGGRRASAIYTPIATAKLNDIDPQAWLADGLPADLN